MPLTQHNFNIVKQDSTNTTYFTIYATEGKKILEIGNYVFDADGEPQEYSPIAPITILN